MQICNATVRLSGDVRFQVPKEGITPAEILVLQHVQAAEDAVADIVVTGETDRNMHVEFDRLCQIYGDKRVRQLFPGAHPRLPVTFDEINIVAKSVAPPPAPEAETKPAPRQRRQRQAAGDPVAAAERQDEREPVAAAEAREAAGDDDDLMGQPLAE